MQNEVKDNNGCLQEASFCNYFGETFAWKAGSCSPFLACTLAHLAVIHLPSALQLLELRTQWTGKIYTQIVFIPGMAPGLRLIIAFSQNADSQVMQARKYQRNGTFEFCHYYYDDEQRLLKIAGIKITAERGYPRCIQWKRETPSAENYVEGRAERLKLSRIRSDKQSFCWWGIPAEFPGGTRAWINYLFPEPAISQTRPCEKISRAGSFVVFNFPWRQGWKTEVIQSVDKLLDRRSPGDW